MDAQPSFRDRLYVVIFGTDTPAGRAFDVLLLCVISLSVLSTMIESVDEYAVAYREYIRWVETSCTALFTLEYIARIYCARRRLRYVRSFFGVVDLLCLLPTYIGWIFGGVQSLTIIRSFRLMRVFRVFKVVRMLREANALLASIRESAAKITVFIAFVLIVALVSATAMYVIEGKESGFSSIPRATYWAVVTVTTVGYGDIAPQTVLGQFLATMLMVLGYGVIAVPTGIVTAKFVQTSQESEGIACPHCDATEHHAHAAYCYNCGDELDSARS